MKSRQPPIHDVLHQRFASLPAPPEDARLVLGTGTAADYAGLAAHHYRAARPATMKRILVLRDPAPTVADRFLGRAPTGTVVAVLVESLPTLSCRLRDAALSDRYASLPARQRGKLLNAEVRCISRVVVDPRYRGFGLAVRLVRHALATATTVYTEALAAMGIASPFFEKAGMAAYHRPPHPHDERFLAALEAHNIHTDALSDPDALLRRIDRMQPTQRAAVRRELSRWYRSAVGRAAGSSQDPAEHLRAAQTKLLSRPVYYLHDNRKAATD